MSQAFPGMSREASVFYCRVFAEVMLNLQAVRTGLFDVYLAETEDPMVAIRFRDEIPNIMMKLRERASRGLGDEK